MYLRIGGRLRPFNEVKSPTISYRPIYDAKRRMVSIEETWQLIGRIVLQTDATQRRMTAAINRLKADLDQVRPDLLYIEDDGVTPSAFQLLASQCADGPNVTEASFPSDGADVYATGMLWAATITARRLLSGVGGNPIIEFTESVSNPSGGTVIGFVGGAINLPERQRFKQNEPYIYIQSGRAVGLFGYPTAPGPIWPGAQLRAMRPVHVSPRIHGPVPQEFETQWEYEFGNEFPLIGRPHILI